MLKLFFLSILILSGFSAISQVKATTENGKEVILFDNGTWKLNNDSTNPAVVETDTIKTNPVKFTKTDKSSFLVKSNVSHVGVYINPAKWSFSVHSENETFPEYRFTMRSGNGYAMLITEKIQVEMESTLQRALINAQKAGPDAKIDHAEYRIVNNQKILCAQISCTIKGIRYIYLAYYFSSEYGTSQLLTYTTQKLFKESGNEMEDFLNGFTNVEK